MYIRPIVTLYHGHCNVLNGLLLKCSILCKYYLKHLFVLLFVTYSENKSKFFFKCLN